jgi:hypothetical protein
MFMVAFFYLIVLCCWTLAGHSLLKKIQLQKEYNASDSPILKNKNLNRKNIQYLLLGSTIIPNSVAFLEGTLTVFKCTCIVLHGTLNSGK